MTTTDLSSVLANDELRKLEQYNDMQSGDFIPTMRLRVAVPSGTHTPDQQQLQQLWVAPTLGGGVIESWRNIQREIVQS